MVQSIEEARRRSRGTPSRVPPHNLKAEESLLGAMLLTRDAVAAALETCAGQDFYKPAHAHIFDAILSLYSKGEPADPVTVADELARSDLLDTVGGLPALTALQADTPATSNAGRYARIVEEHALLRRLIGVAGEIAEMGYSVPDDVTSAVDRAESMVFEVSSRRVTDSLKTLRELLEESLDRLDALYGRGETITGVPTGFVDLDERLSGLQASSLVIVGARPSMGKALALDTPIPAPAGWTTMRSISVGDSVFDEGGRPCTVTYTSPVQHDRTCYRVEFDDGTVMVADADHQWFAYDLPAWRSARGRLRLSALESPTHPLISRDQSRRWERDPRVVTTQEMLDEGLRYGNRTRPNWYLPLAGALDLPETDLPVDPYEFGCLLGRSKEHIPAPYLRASFKQRLALLQGILDTDGHANLQGGAELCLADRLLCEQVRELVCSLGHKPEQLKRKETRLRDGRTAEAWRLTWIPLDPVFRMSRKADTLAAAGSQRRSGKSTWRAVTAIVPIDSVPVRCISVDSPSHLYIAGESMVPTHNTSFALGIAAHATMEAGIPTLLFSLEMSHSEITQRLLVSEARVDAARIRNGRLIESDWPKINNAIGRLGEAPLFVDDNPNLTVMEIRAKARRLKARAGLGLIIVDYLQLMSGQTAENRQVEVSTISRGLKILARELEVPVVALSQLSRNLEMRQDKRPVLADLRESGCMPADTRLLRADNGEEVTLANLLLSEDQPLVWALNDDWQLVPRRLTKVFASGKKEVFRLRAASGLEVEASANHRFRTVDGWVRLDEIAVGDHLATPRRIPPPTDTHEMSDDEIVLLAHSAHKLIPERVFGLSNPRLTLFLHHLWAADGSITLRRDGHGPMVRVYYSSSSRRLADGVRRALLRLSIQSRVYRSGKVGYGDMWNVAVSGRPSLVAFLETVGCHGQGGQRVPRRLEAVLRHRSEPNVDLVPCEVRHRVKSPINTGLSHSAVAGSMGAPYCGSYPPGGETRPRRASRGPLADITAVAHDRSPEDLANSDVMWDQVIEITPVGQRPTFDATVEGDHNFIANGIIAHNSLEQDADVVMFLYRDEVYNPDSPDRGTAEVIVSKHRNGPTGSAQLAFLDHYTRFANMARG